MKRAGVWGEKTLASLTILPRRFTLAPDLSFEYGPSLACIISKLSSSAKSSICQFYEHNRRKPKFNSPAWEADSLFVRMYTFFRFRDKLYWHVSVLCICDLLPLSRSLQNIKSCSAYVHTLLSKKSSSPIVWSCVTWVAAVSTSHDHFPAIARPPPPTPQTS